MRLNFQLLQHVHLNVTLLFPDEGMMQALRNIILLIIALRIVRISSVTGSVTEVNSF